MARLNLTNKQFAKTINKIIDDIRRVHDRKFYNVEFNEELNAVYLTPDNNMPFYATYLEKFQALQTIYDISFWFEVRNGKPCMAIFNE